MSGERRVRITLEAMAVQSGHSADVLRIRQDNGSVTWIDTRGVTVEDVTPARVWTDGDVVRHADDNYVAHRVAGGWHTTTSRGVWSDDEKVSQHVESGRLVVLRYQAGE